MGIDWKRQHTIEPVYFICRRDGVMLELGAHFRESFGLHPSDIIGRNIRGMVEGIQLTNGRKIQLLKINSINGMPLFVQCIIGRDGICRGWIYPATAQYLLQLIGSADDINMQIRKHFHDLKSPLNALNGLAYILNEEAPKFGLEKDIEMMQLAVNNMKEAILSMERYLRPSTSFESTFDKQEKEVPHVEFSLKGKQIAYAEDDPANRSIVSAILQKADAEVVSYENGKLLLNGTTNIPSLVLLDMEMPELNGKMTSVELQKRWIEKTPPQVALTGYFDHDTKMELLCMGFDDVISKPVKGDELIYRLNNLLNGAKLPFQSVVDGLESLEVIDVKKLDTIAELGGKSLVVEAVNSFIHELKDEIEYLYDEKNVKTISESSRILHNLKSSAASLGFRQFSLMCCYQESKCRKNSVDFKDFVIFNRYFCDILSQWEINICKLYE